MRAYMHGFFVHNKLWQKAKAISNPVSYDEIRKQRIQSKLEAERAQRITLKRKLPKVGCALQSVISGVQGVSLKLWVGVLAGQCSIGSKTRNRCYCN